MTAEESGGGLGGLAFVEVEFDGEFHAATVSGRRGGLPQGGGHSWMAELVVEGVQVRELISWLAWVVMRPASLERAIHWKPSWIR